MFLAYFIGIILITWAAATYFVEQEGKEVLEEKTVSMEIARVMIILDPDPIYDLDLQVAGQIAEAMNDEKVSATIASVAIAKQMDLGEYDLVVFCANTYNWLPDRVVTGFIKKSPYLLNKKVAALTLGAGSTKNASNKLNSLIQEKGANLVSSKELWLMRPNKEEEQTKPNITVARELAYEWGKELAMIIE